MPDHLCAFADDRFEEIAEEFIFASFTDGARDLAPHVCDESDIPKRRATAEFAEHVEIRSGGSVRLIVRDAVGVDDPCELKAFLISVERWRLEGRETTGGDVHSRSGQKSCGTL